MDSFTIETSWPGIEADLEGEVMSSQRTIAGVAAGRDSYHPLSSSGSPLIDRKQYVRLALTKSTCNKMDPPS